MSVHRSVFISVVMFVLTSMGTAETAFCATPDATTTMPGLALQGPTGVAAVTFANLSSSGNRYIADAKSNQVFVVNSAGSASVLAGDPAAVSLGDGGLATGALLNGPSGIAVDSKGNVYIADTLNHRIRMIVANKGGMLDGTNIIKTVAGNGTAGYSGDGAAATAASLKSPTGVAVDADGNIYIADNGNYRVRKVDTSGKISKLAGDGTATTLTAYSLTLTPAGDLYIADSGNNRILRIAAGKTALETVVGNGTAGYSGDGGLATLAHLNQPSGVATDGVDIYITDTLNNCVRKLSISTGVISTRAGSAPQAAINATFSSPLGIALDAAGNQYVADSGNNAIKQIYASVSAITTASPPGGNYTKDQSITLTANRAVKNISYTTDGTNPLTSGTNITYTGPFTLSANTTLKFASVDVLNNNEVTNTAQYAFYKTAPVTTAVLSGGSLVGGSIVTSQATVTVKLTASDPTATIYYTTNGTIPTTASTRYTLPISILATEKLTTTTLQFFAADLAGNKELVKTEKYSVVALVTSATPAGGTYFTPKTVTLTATSANAAIYYTTDGSTPTIYSQKYSSPLVVNKTTILKYFAVDTAGNVEAVKTQTYTINSLTTTATPAGGRFASNQAVTLEANETGAAIYYTIDGTTPKKTSKKFTAPILITDITTPRSTTTVLQYFAVDQSGVTEDIKTQIYVIDKVVPATIPNYDAPNGTLTLATNNTADRIRYRLYGSAQADYTSPLAIPGNTIVKFFATSAAGNAEQTQTFYCPSATPGPALYLETLPNGATTSNSTLYIGGNAAPFDAATLTIALNGGAAVPVTTSQTDGSFSYQLDISAAAEYTIVTTVTDSGNNVSDTRTIHKVAPAAPPVFTVSHPMDNSTVKSPSISVAGTVNATITKVQVDNTSITPQAQAVVMAGNGFTSNVALAPGLNIITINATDINGNTLPAESRNVTYDPAGPALYLTSPANDADTASNTVSLKGQLMNSSPPVTLNYLLSDGNNGLITLSPDGSFSQDVAFNLPLPASGTIQVTAADGAGRVATIGRKIAFNPALGATTLDLGATNVVEGYTVRLPLTLTGGYQPVAASIDIGYDPKQLTNPSASLAPAAAALAKVVNSSTPSPGVFRVLVKGNATTLPDGVIAYVTFGVLSTEAGGITLTNIGSAADADSHSLAVTGKNGVVNIMSSPGDRNGDGVVSISEVQAALNMLLLPATNTVDGAMDLDGDGTVSVNELQQVVNSFLGLQAKGP